MVGDWWTAFQWHITFLVEIPLSTILNDFCAPCRKDDIFEMDENEMEMIECSTYIARVPEIVDLFENFTDIKKKVLMASECNVENFEKNKCFFSYYLLSKMSDFYPNTLQRFSLFCKYAANIFSYFCIQKATLALILAEKANKSRLRI